MRKYLPTDLPVSPASLIWFRTLFGLLMTISTVRFMCLGWIEDHYSDSTFHFTYWGLSFIKPLPIFWMYCIHIVMIISSLGIIFCKGIRYRIFAILLFLSFTYTEAIDVSYYLNHYYFVSLICFLLIFFPSHISLIYRKKGLIPSWPVYLLKFQITLLYVYAGLAKINHDWLIEAMPLRIWLPAKDSIPLLGPLFSWYYTPWIFSWAGMLYDTFIILFLINKRTRIFAFLTVITFHTLTGILFQIGVFPIVMIGAATLFFSSDTHEKWLDIIYPRVKDAGTIFKSSSVYLKTGIYIYMVFQMLFPWRYLLYPGNLFLTEEGYRFSWRVMLAEKAGTATFYVTDKCTGRRGIVQNSEFLNLHQEKQMSYQPDMILQFAHYLRDYYSKRGLCDPKVTAEVYVTLNSRPAVLLIDPNRNLSKEKDTFAPKDWIIGDE